MGLKMAKTKFPKCEMRKRKIEFFSGFEPRASTSHWEPCNHSATGRLLDMGQLWRYIIPKLLSR